MYKDFLKKKVKMLRVAERNLFTHWVCNSNDICII